MKIILKLGIIFLAACAPSYAATDILHVRLEWLNAKECGFEGCKPQNIIMRSGSSMTFSWPRGSELEELGSFVVLPVVQDESVRLKLKRSKGPDTVAEIDRAFAMSVPQEVALKEVNLRITVTEEEPKAKK
jgi:hypothetical protein